MKIKMTDDDVILDFYEAVNRIGNYYSPRKFPSMLEHYKPCSEWRLNARDHIFELVMMFYPYMYTRRQKKMREFLTWYLCK